MEIPPDLLADALRGTDDMAAVARSLATLLLRMGSRDGGLTRETADAVTDLLTPVATGAECGRAFVALTTAPVAQGASAVIFLFFYCLALEVALHTSLLV